VTHTGISEIPIRQKNKNEVDAPRSRYTRDDMTCTRSCHVSIVMPRSTPSCRERARGQTKAQTSVCGATRGSATVAGSPGSASLATIGCGPTSSGRFLEIEKVLTVTTWASIFCFFVPMLSPFLIGWFVEIPAWFYIPSLPSMCIFLFSLVKAQDLAKKTHGRMERLFKDSAQSSATSA
jgi:hypothetical protein